MILASQNVQIAEEKDFVREKIRGIFFVNTSQRKRTQSGAFALKMMFAFANDVGCANDHDYA